MYTLGTMVITSCGAAVVVKYFSSYLSQLYEHAYMADSVVHCAGAYPGRNEQKDMVVMHATRNLLINNYS